MTIGSKLYMHAINKHGTCSKYNNTQSSNNILTHKYIVVHTVPKLSLYLEAVVDCVSKPRIFIQCSRLIAPLCGYESAL